MSAETQVAKWGNSLAVRLPRALAREAGIAEGDVLSLALDSNGAILLRPPRKRYDLGQLVARITPRNRHKESDWGAPAGKESW